MSGIVFIFGNTMYDTVTISFAGTDAISQSTGAQIAANPADTTTACCASAVDINLGSDTVFIIGAGVYYDTVTVSLARTDAIGSRNRSPTAQLSFPIPPPPLALVPYISSRERQLFHCHRRHHGPRRHHQLNWCRHFILG